VTPASDPLVASAIGLDRVAFRGVTESLDRYPQDQTRQDIGHRAFAR